MTRCCETRSPGLRAPRPASRPAPQPNRRSTRCSPTSRKRSAHTSPGAAARTSIKRTQKQRCAAAHESSPDPPAAPAEEPVLSPCCDLLQQHVDAREALLRALLDAVLHCGVALLGRLEAHRLRQLRLVAEILELQRLQVVLERLHEALGWLDLAELALDDAG